MKVATKVIQARPFTTRAEIRLKVAGLGPKTFQNSIAFLRVHAGPEVLDETAVHPEHYAIAQSLLAAARDSEGANTSTSTSTSISTSTSTSTSGKRRLDESPSSGARRRGQCQEETKNGTRKPTHPPYALTYMHTRATHTGF